MKTPVAVALAAFLLTAPTWASDPGQPLDCSDWVIVEPGISCSELIAGDCNDSPFCRKGDNLALDTEANFIVLRKYGLGEACGASYQRSRLEIVRRDGVSESVIAYVDERCPAGLGVMDRIDGVEPDPCPTGGCTTPDTLRLGRVLHFDPYSGRLFVPLRNRCQTLGNACQYEESTWLAAFDGFTTTFEILQTYEPPSGPLGFRVPYMPEGMEAADYFDTYYGTLATVGDWSQAQPLQCGYPSTPLTVGDYLEVADTLPTPGPGQGYYYITAATYLGETRYGRKAEGGELSGRDPALLPPCDARLVSSHFLVEELPCR